MRFWGYIYHGFKKPDEFYYINIFCLAVGGLGALFSGVVFFMTGHFDGVFGLNFCLRNQCIVRFSSEFSSVLLIVKSTGGIMLGVFAFGSFGIACKNYVNTKKAFNSNIHVSNMGVFLSYVESEIDKRDKLKSVSFDVLKWYNVIFDNSKNGDLEVSYGYIKALNEIFDTMRNSNHLFCSPTNGEFRYKEHQTRIMENLSAIGISLHRMPRLDFHEVEGQVLSLIEVVNSSFCYLDVGREEMPVRQYR